MCIDPRIERCERLLSNLGVRFSRYDHEPIFTVDQGKELLAHIPGAGTKNLFLRDKNGTSHFLITVREEKRVDLKRLAQTLGSSRLGFASSQRLTTLLGVEPGSVTIMGLHFDKERAVSVVVDPDLIREEWWQIHPLTNSATLVVHGADIMKFFERTGHTVRAITIPIMEEEPPKSGIDAEADLGD